MVTRILKVALLSMFVIALLAQGSIAYADDPPTLIFGGADSKFDTFQSQSQSEITTPVLGGTKRKKGAPDISHDKTSGAPVMGEKSIVPPVSDDSETVSATGPILGGKKKIKNLPVRVVKRTRTCYNR